LFKRKKVFLCISGEAKAGSPRMDEGSQRHRRYSGEPGAYGVRHGPQPSLAFVWLASPSIINI